MGDSPARKARLRAATEAKLSELRQAGASCGNCTQFERRKDPGGKGHYCERDSDFQGYAVTTADQICTKHSNTEE